MVRVTRGLHVFVAHTFVHTYWHSASVSLDESVQKKNFPLNSWTPTMAKMSRKRM